MTVSETAKLRIMQLCDERNISINMMCAMEGITHITINNTVNGRNKSTALSTIKKICDALDITYGRVLLFKAV